MSDETVAKNQDTSLNGDTSGGEGSTSTATFTKAQVEEAAKKAASDALAKAGRDAKALAEREARLKEQETKYQDWQRRQQEAEEEQYRNDPDTLKLLKEKRAIKAEREEVERLRKENEAEKAAHAERLTKAEETERELTVWRTATEKGVNAETLKAKVTKLGLKTPEQITELADTMAPSNSEAKQTFHFDSNKGSGGNNLSGLSPSQKIAKGLEKLKK